MAALACSAETLLATVVHGSFSYGIAVAVSYELSVQDVVIRGEARVGPSCRSIVGKDLTCVCSFLVAPPQDSDVVNDLVITVLLADGTSIAHTLSNMVTRGSAYEFNRESPPAMYRQSFCHVGDMSVNGVGEGEDTALVNVG